MKEISAFVHRSRIAGVVTALKASPAWGRKGGDRRHNLAVYVVKGLRFVDWAVNLASRTRTLR